MKQVNAGTIVTSLATPCFRPPTVEATWVPCPEHPEPSAGRMPLTAWHESHSVCSRDYTRGGKGEGMGWWGSAGARGIIAVVGGGVCGRRLARPHRVPVDHAASEVDVRALYARVHDIHAHALARQIAVVVSTVDPAALNKSAVVVPGVDLDAGRCPTAPRSACPCGPPGPCCGRPARSHCSRAATCPRVGGSRP